MRGHRILVVRNDALGTHLRASCLARDGVAIHVAASEQDALGMAATERADLILLDRESSAISAAEFCRAVRALPPSAGCKLILLHDEPDCPAALEFKLSGGECVLARSTEPAALAALVAQLLGLPLRKTQRVNVQVLVKLELPSLGETPFKSMFANTVDVSTAGVRLEAQHPLDGDSKVRLHLVLPGTQQRLSVDAVVRHVVDEELMQYGLEFLDMTEEARGLVAAFLLARGAA